MGKVPFKTLFFALFCAAGAACLGGCIEPVNLATFVRNEEVAEILDRGAGTVSIHESEAGLEARNGKIIGLDPDKYYLAEEWDENGNPLGVQFVGANGVRGENLTAIGKASGGEITGLKNVYHYHVSAAKPLTGGVNYDVFIPPGSPGYELNPGGLIILPSPVDNSTIVYTLTPPLPAAPSYDIVEIAISPLPGSAVPADRLPGNDIITRIKKETVIDYVFYAGVDDFYVLRVASSEGVIIPPDPGDGVNLIPNFVIGDGSPTLEWSMNATGPWGDVPAKPGKLPQTSGLILYLRVKDSGDYTDIKWYCNSATSFATGDTYTATLGTTAPFDSVKTYDLLVIGTWTDGKPYGTTVFIQVDN